MKKDYNREGEEIMNIIANAHHQYVTLEDDEKRNEYLAGLWNRMVKESDYMHIGACTEHYSIERECMACIIKAIMSGDTKYVYRGDGLLECVLNHVDANNVEKKVG